MGNPRFVEELIFLPSFHAFLSPSGNVSSNQHLESLWKVLFTPFCLLCLGVGSSRRLQALQPGDSGQTGDSGGKYPETPAVGKTSG
jgi:hypothetical protein